MTTSPADAPVLTRRAREVLQQMADTDAADDDAEIVCERGQCWLADDRIAPRTVRQLLMAVLVGCDGFGDRIERYHINEAGRRLLAGLPPYCDRDGRYHWEFTDLL